ncbi:IS1634 family transposase [Microbacterium lacticum]|uniref:IS1634 family transposase n=1 Tax=Microbacterium lacticum TaxID=33885 RepID=UPI003211B176
MGLFVRKVRTGSGATAVQIARTRRGVQTILEHLGSAHDDAQLAVLVAIARERIAEMNGQEQLDLDALAPASPPQSSGPIVTGSRSRVLWEVLEDAYAGLGFDAVGNDTFKKLVLARVVEPTSKADTLRVWDELGVPAAPSLSTVWRTLARSVEQDWRSKIAAAAYAHATREGPLTVVLYDVTTLYFGAEREDKLRRVGMSKERRVDPQILVGLLVDQGGFPLEVHEFAGNKGETLTLLPVLDQFRERHQATEVVVVADAGMLSASNLNRLEDAGFGFIVGSRTSSAPYDLAEHYATVGNIVTDGETVETTRTMGAGVNARERRVVWQYSHKRKIRDNITLNKQIERAEQIAAGTRPAKKDRFVTLGTGPGVNWARVDKAREYIGLKGYVTNLSTTTATATEVVAAYHDLFQVETTFRMAKTDLRARPMFASTEDSIHAHLTVVFTALAISRHLYKTTGFTVRRIVRALRPLRDVTISIDGHELTAPTPPQGEAAEILAKLYP